MSKAMVAGMKNDPMDPVGIDSSHAAVHDDDDMVENALQQLDELAPEDSLAAEREPCMGAQVVADMGIIAASATETAGPDPYGSLNIFVITTDQGSNISAVVAAAEKVVQSPPKSEWNWLVAGPCFQHQYMIMEGALAWSTEDFLHAGYTRLQALLLGEGAERVSRSKRYYSELAGVMHVLMDKQPQVFCAYASDNGLHQCYGLQLAQARASSNHGTLGAEVGVRTISFAHHEHSTSRARFQAVCESIHSGFEGARFFRNRWV